MKKIHLLLITAVLTATVMAENVKVQLTTGKIAEGVLISYTEDVLVIEPNKVVKYEKRFTPNDVAYFDIEGVGRCISIDGKFIFDESTRIIHVEATPINETTDRAKVVEPSNPNEVIGKALKTCGSTALGIGIPALLAGTILVAYGNTELIALPKTIEEANKNATKVKCAAVGYVLMPFGAALTVVGFPLYAKGKQIAELNFNYTGNGAGIAVNF